MCLEGEGGGTVKVPVFRGEIEVDSRIQDRKNDQFENPSTSSDADFLLVHNCLYGIIFDR